MPRALRAREQGGGRRSTLVPEAEVDALAEAVLIEPLDQEVGLENRVR